LGGGGGWSLEEGGVSGYVSLPVMAIAEVIRGSTARHVDVKLDRVGVASSGVIWGGDSMLSMGVGNSLLKLSVRDLLSECCFDCIASSDTRLSLRGGESIGDVEGCLEFWWEGKVGSFWL